MLARTYTTSDPGKAWWDDVPFAPGAQAEAFWNAAMYPWALDGEQADWFLRLRFEEVIREIRDLDAARLGATRIPNLILLTMI